MTFSATERNALAARVRYELGYSSLTVAGEPYFAIAYAPEVALDSLYSAAETTSATAVTSTDPTGITLASPTGFAAGVRVHVDVGPQREVVVAQSLSGSVLTARFSKTHSGTYPVEVESGESMLRSILTELENIGRQLAAAPSTGGIKQVDKGDVIFFGDAEGKSRLDALRAEQTQLRNDLGGLLKLPNLWNRSGSNRLEAY